MRQGFTLVELAIVLVILGLLVGAVVTGQSLIRNAELRAITTEYSKFIAAVRTFQDMYFALPGDMRNAEAFWGTMSSGTCPDATGGTGTQTCNGNGDRVIDGASAASKSGERHTFWQHLANAELIEGSYTGIAGSGHRNDVDPGINSPASKFSGGGWSVVHNNSSGYVDQYDSDAANRLFFGVEKGIYGTYAQILTPKEAWNVDTKIDDGRPGRGKVRVIWWDECTDASDSADFDADYDFTVTDIACALEFRGDF